MTVADLAERVPTQAITAKAREIRFWATLLQLLTVALRLLAGLLFGLGWVAYKTVAGVWFVCVWVVSAVVLGWATARGLQPAAED